MLFIAALIIGINIFIYWLYPLIDGKRKNKSRDIIPLCSGNMYLAVIIKSDHSYEFIILNRNEVASMGGVNENQRL